MQLTYYNNLSDRRYLNKELQLISLQGHSNPVTIKILDPTNIIHPVFKMADADLYMTANYCYVDALRRYYFIDSIECCNGFGLLHCTVDVLESFKDQLLKTGVILKRQQYIYDTYQNDGEIPVEQYPAKRCVGHFNTPFQMTTNTYVMGVVGNTSGGENNGND